MPFNWNMIPINRGLALIMGAAMLVSACGHSANPVVIHADSTGNINVISLSPKFTAQLGLRYEHLNRKPLSNDIECSGNIVTESENKLNIQSPYSGKIAFIHKRINDPVHAGSLIATIENSDFIKMQQEYLEAQNNFEFHKEEFTRQGDLTVENATSIKKMQIARRDYQSAELKYHAITLQLRLLGIHPDSINPENLLAVLPLTAPRSGILSGIFIQSGSYVEQGTPLFELVAKQYLSVRIYVPESSYHLIQLGQAAICHPLYDSLSKINATIRTIVPRVDPVSKTVTVFADISHSTADYIEGMNLKVKVTTGTDTICMISSSAILKDLSGNYLIVRDQGFYRKLYVKQGNTYNGLTQLFDVPAHLSDSVVVSGHKQVSGYFRTP
jgi:membrane fusion protein, heavy metal efflux system